jgi:hypothetical protein
MLCDTASYLVFAPATAGLCLYTARFRSRSNIPVVVVWLTLAAVTTLTLLQAMSTCNRMLLTWGAVLIGLYCFLAGVETCLCMTREPPPPPPVPRPPAVSVVGTVRAVGRIAATVETKTQRQFYAPLHVWGRYLQPGDRITFWPDPSRTSGEHIVDGTTYAREYCSPYPLDDI